MYNKQERNYYNVTLVSSDDSHYLNIYVSKDDGVIGVSVSKSEDGFYFKSPCDEANDLELSSSDNLEETYNYVKNHFLDKEYKFSTF
jgi:hypothetical protein